MSVFDGLAPGDLKVTENGTINGMVSRDLIIAAGCDVTVNGMVGRNVVLGAGARAEVRGMMGGQIVRGDGA